MARPRMKSQSALERTAIAACDRWNNAHESGTKVVVTRDLGQQFETVTRSAAYVLGGHSAVIMVEGISGCYALDRVRPV